MFMLATNFPEKIDTAVHSRMSQQFQIPLPEINARVQIIEMHMEILAKKSKETEPLLSHELIRQIGENTEYCSARDLQQIVNLIHSAKHAAPTKQISQTAIEDIVKRKATQAVAALVCSLGERGLLEQPPAPVGQQKPNGAARKK